MTDIVIPYQDKGSSELRYCLRSIAKNVEHDKIIIVGDRPPEWLSGDVDYVWWPQGKNRYRNVWQSYMYVPPERGDVLLFNDDYFVMHPGPIENHHSGQLRVGHPMRTALQVAGYRSRFNYEGHFPMRVHWPWFIDSIQRLPTPLLRWMRTWYGNRHPRLDPTRIGECKIMTNRQVAHLGTRRFISTSEHSWAGFVGTYIRSVFSEPCRYERFTWPEQTT